MPGERRDTRLRIVGGPQGTTVEAPSDDDPSADAALEAVMNLAE
jgi:hypothetical protein